MSKWGRNEEEIFRGFVLRVHGVAAGELRVGS